MVAQLCGTLNLQGIYMAMPTVMTSNQTYGRLSAMLESLGGGHCGYLLLSLAWLLGWRSPEPGDLHLDRSESGGAQSAAQWLAPVRRRLLAANAVGTVNQGMAAVVYRKYSLLRLTGFASTVLVIDEILACDTYMSQIIERLLMWCGSLGIPVILLSATLPRAQKERYLVCYSIRRGTPLSDAYPLITQVNAQCDLVETDVAGAHMYKKRSLIRLLRGAHDQG